MKGAAGASRIMAGSPAKGWPFFAGLQMLTAGGLP